MHFVTFARIVREYCLKNKNFKNNTHLLLEGGNLLWLSDDDFSMFAFADTGRN